MSASAYPSDVHPIRVPHGHRIAAQWEGESGELAEEHLVALEDARRLEAFEATLIKVFERLSNEHNPGRIAWSLAQIRRALELPKP